MQRIYIFSHYIILQFEIDSVCKFLGIISKAIDYFRKSFKIQKQEEKIFDKWNETKDKGFLSRWYYTVAARLDTMILCVVL